ncbi:hypothetical protein AWENTII_005175 [Aspergillus wentii]
MGFKRDVIVKQEYPQKESLLFDALWQSEYPRSLHRVQGSSPSQGSLRFRHSSHALRRREDSSCEADLSVSVKAIDISYTYRVVGSSATPCCPHFPTFTIHGLVV